MDGTKECISFLPITVYLLGCLLCLCCFTSYQTQSRMIGLDAYNLLIQLSMSNHPPSGFSGPKAQYSEWNLGVPEVNHDLKEKAIRSDGRDSIVERVWESTPYHFVFAKAVRGQANFTRQIAALHVISIFVKSVRLESSHSASSRLRISLSASCARRPDDPRKASMSVPLEYRMISTPASEKAFAMRGRIFLN